MLTHSTFARPSTLQPRKVPWPVSADSAIEALVLARGLSIADTLGVLGVSARSCRFRAAAAAGRFLRSDAAS